MKVFMWLFGLGLFCNVLAVGINLFLTGAGWVLYVNLFGCVMYGAWLVDRLKA